jgi:gamma-glutamylcyclotransferase
VSGIWYFAYGSNMETATLCGRRRIRLSRALPARAAGWRLVLDKPPLVPIGEAFANIVPDAAAHVLGVLYDVDAVELDHVGLTEGVLVGNYEWMDIPVATLATPEREVVARTLVSQRHDPTLVPSHRYMACLIAGAVEHGLPPEYVAWLRAVPARPQTPEALQFQALVDEAFGVRARD